MTSQERLLAAMHGELPDRLPWAPEFNIVFCDRILDEIHIKADFDSVRAIPDLLEEQARFDG